MDKQVAIEAILATLEIHIGIGEGDAALSVPCKSTWHVISTFSLDTFLLKSPLVVRGVALIMVCLIK